VLGTRYFFEESQPSHPKTSDRHIAQRTSHDVCHSLCKFLTQKILVDGESDETEELDSDVEDDDEEGQGPEGEDTVDLNYWQSADAEDDFVEMQALFSE
jgi:hypothetical protein